MPTNNDGTVRQTTPTIWNPSQNSPIKAPEPKFCITCGQPIAPDVRPLTNEMSVYVNSINGSKVALNDTADQLTIQGVLLFKEGSASHVKWVVDTAQKNVPATQSPVTQSQQVSQQVVNVPAKSLLNTISTTPIVPSATTTELAKAQVPQNPVVLSNTPLTELQKAQGV